MVPWSGITALHHSWEFLLKDGAIPTVNHLELKEINKNECVREQRKGSPLLWRGLEKLKVGSVDLFHCTDCPVQNGAELVTL